MDYNAYEKNIAIVNIFFGGSTVFGEETSLEEKHRCHLKYSFYSEFERSPKMTWLDFISGFGGICGLCLGISFVSVTELFYWFSVRLCRTLVRDLH